MYKVTKRSIVNTQKNIILDILDKYGVSLGDLTDDAFKGNGFSVEHINDLTFNQADVVINYVKDKTKRR